MRLNSALLTMALSLTLAPLGLAQSQAPAHPPSAPAEAAPTTPRGAAPPPTRKLSEAEVIRALEVRGYTEIRTVRRNGDALEMQAKKNGKPVKVVVNIATGQIGVEPR